MRRCCIRWSMVIECLPHLVAHPGSMKSCWNAGTATLSEDPPSKRSNGNWRISLQWRVRSTKKRRLTEEWPTPQPIGCVTRWSCTTIKGKGGGRDLRVWSSAYWNQSRIFEMRLVANEIINLKVTGSKLWKVALCNFWEIQGRFSNVKHIWFQM